MTITRQMKTSVFFVPMTLRMTSMFGSDRAGPASSSASAGPLPMPAPIRPCRIGTSVRVAKYMNAPFGGHHALNFDIYGHFTSPIRRLSDLINHWIVHENDVPEDLIELCDRASDRQKDGETVERLYKGFMEEIGLNPYAVNNRGVVTVDEDGDVVHDEGLPPAED